MTARVQRIADRDASAPEDAVLLVACGAAMAALVPVAMYQLGRLHHLPDPRGRVFDSDRITASDTAHPLGVPDSLPGLASYGTTLVLAMLNLRSLRRGQASPRLRRLLGAKLLLDGGLALVNSVRQVLIFRKLCSWCSATALCTGVMVYAGREHIRMLKR